MFLLTNELQVFLFIEHVLSQFQSSDNLCIKRIDYITNGHLIHTRLITMMRDFLQH
ncbi:hypothetical protein VCR31J2_1310997 [Vibrio coralliirubri]|uniref:Uncharacterized protein n=1 Tax=Vibrio coralliirubri TaxID=1516159 RepID=A0AA86WV17_9VIBR|nr:hypothetical protein VCR31J2_1310997 [Vibrio coralliirubri]